MKKAFYILLATMFLIGCDLNDDNEDVVQNPPSVNEANVLRASVGDETFESIDFNTNSNFINDTTLRLSGGNGSSTFTFTIKDYQGVGFYEFEPADSETGVEAIYAIPGSNGVPDRIWTAVIDVDDPDEIIVTEATENSISGTFSYMAENPTENSVIQITSGSFTIELN